LSEAKPIISALLSYARCLDFAALYPFYVLIGREMHCFFAFWWKCARTAFWGNTAFANSWQWVFGIPVISGLSVWANAKFGAAAMSTGNPIVDGLLGALGAFVVTWVVAFVVRLLNAPVALFHFEKARADALEAQVNCQPETSSTFERDVWLFDAICRMYLGRWEQIPFNESGPDLDADGLNVLHDLITKDIRQFAFEGRLPIWGKAAPLALWNLAGAGFWKLCGIDWLSFSYNDPKKLRATGYMVQDQRTVTIELMTSRVAVEKLCASDLFKRMMTTNDANSLRIVAGKGEPFDHLEVNNYGIHHTINVGIKNVGSRKITNCEFFRKYISFGGDREERVFLEGKFSLDPNEIRYVPAAYFDETKELPHADHLIGLTMPPGAFGAGIIAPRMPPGSYTVSFEATSPDSRDAVLHCKLWTDEAGKLNLDPL
jgi:hypothetical protein